MRAKPYTMKKSYALKRMVISLERAIAASSDAAKDKASRWAAAWGYFAGITSPGIRLKQTDVLERRKKPR